MTVRSDSIGTVATFVAIFGWPTSSAHAGPPLISDDPNTVGPGVVQPIFATAAVNRGDETLVRGPIADVTVGLVDSLDAIVVAALASQHDASEEPRWTLSGQFAVGVKWEFFRGDRGSLAFTPAFIIDSKAAREPGALLPIQGEVAVGKGEVVLGFDLGYIPIRNAQDEWFLAPYATWAATKRLNVLGELWSVSFGRAEASDFGASLGIDYSIFGEELRLLVAVSAGIVSVGMSRVDVRAYVGAQYTLGTRRDRWRSNRSNGFQ